LNGKVAFIAKAEGVIRIIPPTGTYAVFNGDFVSPRIVLPEPCPVLPRFSSIQLLGKITLFSMVSK